jgi:hypothetical protein
MSYDSVSVGTTVDAVPELIARIHKNVGSDGAGFRKLRNNVVFVVAEEAKINEMRREMARFLALQELVKPQRMAELAQHQQNTLLEWSRKAGGRLKTAIQLCYRHIFYPSRQPVSPDTELAHSAVEVHQNDNLDNADNVLHAFVRSAAQHSQDARCDRTRPMRDHRGCVVRSWHMGMLPATTRWIAGLRSRQGA